MTLALLPFRAPWLLAPMEGVTDPVFRSLVLALHGPTELGGAFTEFLRVSIRPRMEKDILRHTGPKISPIPVGVQLMGSDPEFMAETARAAVRAGAPLVDINFGCPAKGALKGCAGASMLQFPAGMERMVGEIARAVESESGGEVPTSAKIRAGYDSPDRVDDLAKAVQAGGAAMLTIHCRTRAEGYCLETDWSRLQRAVEAVSIPVCGNGGIDRFEDLQRMRDETGCEMAMVGRAALGDPWIFSGEQVTTERCARFLLEYKEAMLTSGEVSQRGAAGRLKQLLRLWTAGDLVPDEASRKEWLREKAPQALFAKLEGLLQK